MTPRGDIPHPVWVDAVSQPLDTGTGLDDVHRAALFAGPVKLGWVFRDRRLMAAPFAEAAPPPVQEQALAQMQVASAAAQQHWRRTLRETIRYAALYVVLFLAARAALPADQHISLLVLVILAALLVIRLVRSGVQRQLAVAAIGRASRRHERAFTAWQRRKKSHDDAEAERVADFDEWGPAVLPPHVHRLDVFGGSLWGWEALLTVHGTSELTVRPLLVADLTGELVCGELLDAAEDMGLSCSLHLLPNELGATGLLQAFTPEQLATVLSEAMYRTANDSQENRALDVRIIEQATAALGGLVTFTRLTAAIRIILGHPAVAGVLEPAEHAAVTALFPADYRQHVHPSLIRIESLIAPLAAAETSTPKTPASDEPGRLRCLAMDPATHGVRTELLASLLVQWLTIKVGGTDAVRPAVIIAGADEIPRAHLEWLSDTCERHAVPLTLLFRHLRETAAELAGGGGAAVMRLGNHREAATAADLIGRQHKFALSQLTASLGGNQSHARTETEGTSTTRSRGSGGNVGLHLPIGGNPAISFGRNRSRSRASSRNWSTAMSWAYQTNWSDAETKQRVYEYTVEPTTIQGLPDYALLLLTTGTRGLVVTPVECDPAIITLPRVSADPLPMPPSYGFAAGAVNGSAHPHAGNGLFQPGRTSPDRRQHPFANP
jgi:hypothetical protein